MLKSFPPPALGLLFRLLWRRKVSPLPSSVVTVTVCPFFSLINFVSNHYVVCLATTALRETTTTSPEYPTPLPESRIYCGASPPLPASAVDVRCICIVPNYPWPMGFTKYSPLPPIHGAKISNDNLSIRMRAAELEEKDPADQGTKIPVFWPGEVFAGGITGWLICYWSDGGFTILYDCWDCYCYCKE